MPNHRRRQHSLFTDELRRFRTRHLVTGRRNVETFDAFYQLALKRGVHFHFNEEVLALMSNDRLATSLKTKNGTNEFDYLIGGLIIIILIRFCCLKDFDNIQTFIGRKENWHHQHLFLSRHQRKNKKTSYTTIYFLTKSSKQHAMIFTIKKVWPAKPLFYVCVTSRSDDSVAPEGHENVFILIPLATGIADDDTQKRRFI